MGGFGGFNVPNDMQRMFAQKQAQMYPPVPYNLNSPFGFADAIRHRRMLENNAAIQAGHPMYRQNLRDLKTISGELDEPRSATRQYERLDPSAIGEMIRRKNVQLMDQDARDQMSEYSTWLMPDVGMGDQIY